LALTFGPINDAKLNTESLWRERLTAVAPAGHPIAVARPLTWPALVDERLILRATEHDHSVADYVCGLAAAAGCRPLITEFLTTRENMVGLVRAGFGIALLPESSLLSLNTDQLVCIPMTGPGTEMEIVGVWLPENANPALRRFLDASHFGCRGSSRLEEFTSCGCGLPNDNRVRNARSDRMKRSSIAGISRSTATAPKLVA
jgi:Transcriptional regulator